jgi:hypothetical protein
MTKPYPVKITFGEMRAGGVRDILIYCRDYRCGHHIEINADCWADDVRLSDIEPKFFCAFFIRNTVKRAIWPLVRSRPARYPVAARSEKGTGGSAIRQPRFLTEAPSGFPQLLCWHRGAIRTGNGELEFSAVRCTRRSREPPTVCLDNTSTDRQPHAHARGLGREQRVEDAMTDRFFDSGARILDRDLNAAFVVDLRSDP